MEPRTRNRLLKLGLLALLTCGVVYALVLHPGPDLRPQVEEFLRACDADRVSEAMTRTALGQTWELQDLLETTRYRRGALGRFQAFESAEPLERLADGSAPRRLLRARLRFAKVKDPVASTFTFARGTSGWILSDFDIPTPSAQGRRGQVERAKGDAEALARNLAKSEFVAAYERFTREARMATSATAFEERLLPLLDGLGAPNAVRCLAAEPRGTAVAARVEVRYDTGLVRLIELEMRSEDGRWKATSVEVRTPP